MKKLSHQSQSRDFTENRAFEREKHFSFFRARQRAKFLSLNPKVVYHITLRVKNMWFANWTFDKIYNIFYGNMNVSSFVESFITRRKSQSKFALFVINWRTNEYDSTKVKHNERTHILYSLLHRCKVHICLFQALLMLMQVFIELYQFISCMLINK